MWQDIDAQRQQDDRQQRQDERQAARDDEEKQQERKDGEKTVEQHLTELQEYTMNELGIIPGREITPENYPWLAFAEDGSPALFEDKALQDKLNLPDHIKAIQQQNGVIHTALMPGELQPAFAGTMDAAHKSEGILAN